MDSSIDARRLLRTRDFGVLATQSLEVPGYPFGSITPYALDEEGVPLILIASIAQHTRNIVADPRVSLTLWEEGLDDPQAGARLTWMGEATRVAADNTAARDRYIRYFPSSARHFDVHDFALYAISLKRARFIGGFGSIHWLEPAAMGLPRISGEVGILQHMNRDHSDALLAFCKAFKQREPLRAVMVGLDSEGFDVLADGRRLRFQFEGSVNTPDEVRKAMIELTRQAKRTSSAGSAPANSV